MVHLRKTDDEPVSGGEDMLKVMYLVTAELKFKPIEVF